MVRLTTFLKTKEMGAPRLTRPRGGGGPADRFSALGDAVIRLQKRIENSGLCVGGANQVDVAAVAPGALERGDLGADEPHVSEHRADLGRKIRVVLPVPLAGPR